MPKTSRQLAEERLAGQLPLLLTVSDLAFQLRVSEDHIRRMDQDGLLPAPHHDMAFPGAKRRHLRWLAEEIVAWTRAGCPDRAEWQQRKQTTSRAAQPALK